MPQDLTAQRARAERIFNRKRAMKADAPKAVQDYHAAQQAVIDRTKKLREQRLLREARALKNPR